MGDDVSRRRWQHHTRVWNFALTYASYTFQFPHTFWSEDLRSCLLSNKGHRHLPNFKGQCPQGNHIIIDNESLNFVKLQSTLISSMYVYHPHPNHSAQLWRSCVAELLVLTYIPNRLCALGPPSPPTKIAKGQKFQTVENDENRFFGNKFLKIGHKLIL